jgi:hypothetical protein
MAIQNKEIKEVVKPAGCFSRQSKVVPFLPFSACTMWLRVKEGTFPGMMAGYACFTRTIIPVPSALMSLQGLLNASVVAYRAILSALQCTFTA